MSECRPSHHRLVNTTACPRPPGLLRQGNKPRTFRFRWPGLLPVLLLSPAIQSRRTVPLARKKAPNAQSLAAATRKKNNMVHARYSNCHARNYNCHARYYNCHERYSNSLVLSCLVVRCRAQKPSSHQWDQPTTPPFGHMVVMCPCNLPSTKKRAG